MIEEITKLIESQNQLAQDAFKMFLYRHLCKYLYTIDENTAISYVDAYRERWDEEGVKFGNNQDKKEVL